MDDSSSISAGWYPDPEQAGQLRYWDGATWTEQRQARAVTPPPPPGAMPPPSPYPPVTGDKSQAATALVLSVLGIVMCQILAPIGMLMGRNEVLRIDSGQGDPTARGLAQAAWIVGLIGTVILVAFILILLLVFGILASNG